MVEYNINSLLEELLETKRKSLGLKMKKIKFQIIEISLLTTTIAGYISDIVLNYKLDDSLLNFFIKVIIIFLATISLYNYCCNIGSYKCAKYDYEYNKLTLKRIVQNIYAIINQEEIVSWDMQNYEKTIKDFYKQKKGYRLIRKYLKLAQKLENEY